MIKQLGSEEQVIFGTWLRGECLGDMSLFEPKDFSIPAIFELLKNGRDMIQISRELGIGIAELAACTRISTPCLYESAVINWQRDKLLHRAADQLNEKDFQKMQETLNALLTIGERPQAETNLSRTLEKAVKSRQKRETVSYGIKALDELTMGLHPTELTTIGARPACGKSALALQIALHVANQKQKVLYFPLEMSTLQTLERIAGMEGYIDKASIRTGRGINQEKFSSALSKINELERSNCFKIYEGLNDIHRIEYAIKNEQPFLVVIDQLTQLRAKQHFGSRREQFSFMTATLKEIAMRHKVAIILLAQINRTGEETPPTMAQLKESGSIEEDSDNVILLHRVPNSATSSPDSWDNCKRPYLIRLAKQRSGDIGDFGATFYTTNLKFFSL